MRGEEQAVFDRMEVLVRRMAANWSYTADGESFTIAAQGIISDLDRARDPDIALAQRIASSHCGANWSAVLNGIKAGRELRQAHTPEER